MKAATAEPAALLGELLPIVGARISGLPVGAVDLDREWSRSGAAALTGWPARPLLAPPQMTAQLLRIGDWIAALGGARIDPLDVLTARAAFARHRRRGDVSCGGHTRLLRCADGWIGITLARPDDIAAVPAWLEMPEDFAGWDGIAQAVRHRAADELAARARLLGLPAAPLGSVRRKDGPAVLARPIAREAGRATRVEGALVVDLSSLWAGPICARLLQTAGARVLKVESLTRPDGARAEAAFFDFLHGGQESVALDFGSPAGRADLRRLLNVADVVIESSRPRALRQLGIDSDGVLRHGRPRLWISITGYGAEGESGNWVAFGDDAAVAGGLVAWDADCPCFCADAVADPATGLVAAAAALAALSSGRRWKIDVALARVAAALAVPRRNWRVDPAGEAIRPRPRRARRAAHRLGSDTRRVLEEIGSRGASAGAPAVNISLGRAAR